MRLEPWHVALIVTLVVGLAVLLYGHLADKRRLKAHTEKLTSPPGRTIPGYPHDAPSPRYVSAVEARTPPPESAPTDRARTTPTTTADADGITVVATLAGPGFARDGVRAIVRHPVVIITDGPVASLRSLLGILERTSQARRALVLVAAEFDPAVVADLEVNVIQRKFDLIAVTADAGEQVRISELTGADPLSSADLQSGYLPDSAVGSCQTWTASAEQSVVTLAQE